MHYFLQKEKINKDGCTLRPDVIVNLPNGEQIVIDSKSTLLDFDSNDPEEKILQSTKQHIKDLISRNYSGAIENGPNIVLMFVPFDYIFHVISKSNDIEYARKNDIIIVCPTTIVQMLTFVHRLWMDKKQNDNIKEIISSAGDLIDKFCGFCESLSKVGKNINSASTSYNEAITRLVGKGGLHYRIKNLKNKGIESKELPEISVSISNADVSDVRPLEGVEKLFDDVDL
uniref:DNA recombination protein RmuC homolog n=1 Tax=Biomphalaria glabrata TaxID=6526 RepID=A0A2C9LVJ8_BIOGL